MARLIFCVCISNLMRSSGAAAVFAAIPETPPAKRFTTNAEKELLPSDVGDIVALVLLGVVSIVLFMLENYGQQVVRNMMF